MGNPVSKLKESAKNENAEQRIEREQRLNILEKMLTYRLENAKASMIAGERGDQEIHCGVVVEYRQQIYVETAEKSSSTLDDSIKEFFGGHILQGSRNWCL